jgi:pimeloyl-ACP methyl ester carboxylesterase
VQWLNAAQAGPKPRSRYPDADTLARKLMERNKLLAPECAAFIAQAWTRPGPDGGVEIAADPWHRLVNPVLYRREEAEACWRQISAPTLMVLASGSEYLGRLERDDDVSSMQKCIRTLEVARLEGLGHMMHHEDPAAVAAPLIEFVRRHDAGTSALAGVPP